MALFSAWGSSLPLVSDDKENPSGKKQGANEDTCVRNDVNYLDSEEVGQRLRYIFSRFEDTADEEQV